MASDSAALYEPLQVACAASPRCLLSGGFAARFGLRPGAVVYAVHVGPSKDGRSDVVAHPIRILDGGSFALDPSTTHGRRPTPREQLGYPGLSVDYVVTREQ